MKSLISPAFDSFRFRGSTEASALINFASARHFLKGKLALHVVSSHKSAIYRFYADSWRIYSGALIVTSEFELSCNVPTHFNGSSHGQIPEAKPHDKSLGTQLKSLGRRKSFSFPNLIHWETTTASQHDVSPQYSELISQAASFTTNSPFTTLISAWVIRMQQTSEWEGRKATKSSQNPFGTQTDKGEI